MASDCLFCKMVAGAIPVKKVFEDELCLGFEDIEPQAPVHWLLIPKEHITSQAHTTEEDTGTLGHLMAMAAKVARERGIEAQGYRVVINTGEQGGQTVKHLHMHLLSGRKMSWPPG